MNPDRLRSSVALGIVQLDADCQNAFRIAERVAQSRYDSLVRTEHVLFGLIRTTEGRNLITKLPADLDGLIPQLKEFNSIFSLPSSNISEVSPNIEQVIFSADEERQKRGGEEITPADLLIGIFQNNLESPSKLIEGFWHEIPKDKAAYAEENIQRIRTLAPNGKLSERY